MRKSKRKHTPRPDQVSALFTAAEFFEERGELSAAFLCLKAGAEAGDSGAQTNLGNFYAAGTGARKNRKLAEYWYKKAFRQGYSTAAFNLAIDRRNAGDIRGAITWFTKARAFKDGSACLELAKIFLKRKVDDARSRKLLLETLDPEFNTSELDREEASELLRATASAPRDSAARLSSRD